MTGGEALIYARSRHRATGGDFDRGRRQQRVLVSLREQMNVQSIMANLDGLAKAIAGPPSRPTSRSARSPKLLSLADRVDTKNIRSYVFAPSFYGSDTIDPLPRLHHRAERRPDPAGGEGGVLDAAHPCWRSASASVPSRPACGSSTASGRPGLSVSAADRLAYDGDGRLGADPRVTANQVAHTKIVIYNGAGVGDARDDQVPRGPVQRQGHDGHAIPGHG